MMSVCALLAIMQESTPDHAIHGSGARISYNRDTLDETLMVELIHANGAPESLFNHLKYQSGRAFHAGCTTMATDRSLPLMVRTLAMIVNCGDRSRCSATFQIV